MIVVAAMGSPVRPMRFVLMRVLLHLSVIPIYLLLLRLGAGEAAILAVFAALILVVAKVRTGYDPGRLTITEHQSGELFVEGLFAEGRIGSGDNWLLESVSSDADRLTLQVRSGSSSRQLSVTNDSLREPSRQLLRELLGRWLIEGSAAMLVAMDAAGVAKLEANGDVQALISEQPSYAKLVFSSLGISLAALCALYLLFLR